MLEEDNIIVFIDLLKDLKINLTQYFFCKLLLHNKLEELYMYIEEIETIPNEYIIELEELGYIVCWNPSSRTLDTFSITEKFESLIYRYDPDVPGMELWDIYPVRIRVRDKPVFAKQTNRDKFLKDYYVKYGKHVKLHKEIMSLTEYAVKNNLIQCGIQKYLESEGWNSIRLAKKSAPNARPADKLI